MTKPKVGDFVVILGCKEHSQGVVVRNVPEKRGCLVRPDGCKHSFGWGYEELEVISPLPPTAWERLAGPDVDFG